MAALISFFDSKLLDVINKNGAALFL